MSGRRWTFPTIARRAAIVVPLLAVLTGVAAAPALAAPKPPPTSVPTASPIPTALEAKAAGLQARLDEQYAALERISERYDKAISVERALRATLTSVQARQARVASELTEAQDALDEQARAIYEAGPGWFVSELVGASDPSDMLRRVPTQKAALEASARKLDEVRTRKAELDALTERAGSALAEQRRLDADVLSQHQRIDTQAKQLKATLDGIDKRLAAVLKAREVRAEANRRSAFNAWFTSVGAQGQSSWMDAGRVAAAAVAYAMDQRGKPYRWGASGPDAFDCSGLTSSAYRAAGVAIPRVSTDQFYAGQPVAVADLLPGDLVFFADDPANPATIHHVGMYIGKGLMVHAPHTGDVVRVASIWRTGYAGAVRVVAGSRRPGARPPATTIPVPPPTMNSTPPPTTRHPVRGSSTTAPPTTAPPSTTPPTTSGGTTTAPPTTSSETTTAPPTTAAASTTSAETTTTTTAGGGNAAGASGGGTSATTDPPTTTEPPPSTTDPPPTTTTTSEPPLTTASSGP
jgi:cell wall-associated NlpC family hydrolase